MPTRSFRRLAILVVLLAFGGAEVAFAQVFVLPRRPNKSQVRYFDFDWEHLDILVGPEAGPELEPEGAVSVPAPPAVGPQPAPAEPPTETKPRSPTAPTTGGPGEQAPSEPPADDEAGAGPEPPTVPGNPGYQGDPADPAGPGDPSGPGDHGGSGDPGSGNPGHAGPGAAGDPIGQGGAAAGGIERRQTNGGPVPQQAPGPEGSAAQPPTEAPDTKFRKPEDDVRRPGKLGPETGGVRLYFYESEREIAQRAAAYIVDSYRYLAGEFEYVPTRTFPYILYSSYQEFLQTNLFPLQEGVLGVTSPRDLKLTLPYFGDHRMFVEVGTHEMAHQFTIQKVRTLSENTEAWGDPLEGMPLWFIEGLAEYYAQHGLTDEAELLVRDILVNPDVQQGYAMLDFWEDRPFSVLWTYKVGHVRVAFFEEEYGEGTIQRILEKSPLLVGASGKEAQVGGFALLVSRIVGDPPKTISKKFEQWLKKRAFDTYLGAQQDAPAVKSLNGTRGRVDALDAGPEGNLVVYRSIDMNTGRSRLLMFDRRVPDQIEKIVQDGVPDVETLHPVAGRNFDVTDDAVIFVAEADGRDRLYLQRFEHEAIEIEPGKPRAEEVPALESVQGELPVVPWEVRLDLGERVAYEIGDQGILAAYSPAFAPDGKRIAFIGLTEDGLKDVFLLEPKGEDDYTLTALTDDEYAERQLAWGHDSGIVFTSDATEHGKYNLFRVRPEAPGEVERLTTEDRDEFDPLVTPEGRLYFVAYENARADVHEVVEGTVVRRTDISTGLFDLAPGPDGGLWALFHYSGQRRPVILPADNLQTFSVRGMEAGGPAREIPRRSLAGSDPYDPFTPSNWELGNIFGFLGASTSGIFGQVIASASDRLRNHALILSLYVLGSPELTDGYLFYINQEDRITWGGGPFQSLRFRYNRTLSPDGGRELDTFFTSGERFFGVLGSLRYPFNTFVYVQGDLSVGASDLFLTDTAERVLQDGRLNGTGRSLLDDWYRLNDGARFQTEISGRFGYDTIRYHAATGPLSGRSFLLESTAGLQPFNDEFYGNVRLDAEQYLPLFGRTNIFFRVGSGFTFGGEFAREFYLSSFDTLRGVPFGDENWLLGRNFFFSTAELQFPLNAIIRLLIFSDIEGVVAVDFGGVGQDLESLWDKRVLDVVLGVNFGFGPLVFRLHFAKPLDPTFGPPEDRRPGDLPNNGDWVTNFSLGWIYY